eukprot:CAMPEP_0197185068 /NCGR_PEP_ID=MMETSP1423-20130617/11121_1 /TAXON_ID=476441 /ORGANISM="Pseudo-nitzschia heimii, Strain UNC1101" /LENGTH=301 /DNA_ID=CAMNT_0042636031 /DNA_START=598 /DNA_END=1503 /DNA_ORIENTATION=-
MTMDNNISTTVLHQAITSKGDIKKRARVIQEILRITPHASSIKNGYGSLPLHVISQRNTKIDSKTKEMLILDLMNSYPESLTQQGGVGLRTPLHIIFTDYISPKLTATMIQYGRRACFMRDKKGFLPAHVACSRHCSPEKLEMLLQVNPDSLFAETEDGRTLLGLAKSTATKTHPNYALISDLERRVKIASSRVTLSPEMTPLNVQSSIDHNMNCWNQDVPIVSSATRSVMRISINRNGRQSKLNRKRKCNATVRDRRAKNEFKSEVHAVRPEVTSIKQEDSEPANLLLHFSRHMDNVTSV